MAWTSRTRSSRRAGASRAATASRCDNCFGVCPDNAVLKLIEPAEDGRYYAFDLDFCKGCGICAAECPSGAIEMIAETV